ncbi:MAG TPA: quinone-dependent dihydroorotate dehydrogenase [Pyrinomonadaceae bacterium]|nr:quinone-dependent dihydroorotate dehydrogenase [Pyrinomonadaceae bacterium]
MLYRSLLRPILFRLPAETAHELALHSLSFPLAPFLAGKISQSNSNNPSEITRVQSFGLSFRNPVGLAAGFDKDGIALPALAALGFGLIEAGTVTHRPQPGNQRPRLFRLPADKALINRAGFNNDGAAAFARRVATQRPDCILGVSIGKSRETPLDEAVEDYLKSFEAVFPIADYVAVNVSSPNTPQLRELQNATQLEGLIAALNRKNQELTARAGRRATMPLLVKLAPDLEESDLEMIVDVVQRQSVSGIIATNTTTDRSNLQTSAARVRSYGEGGLSGAPLRDRSTKTIACLYKLTQGSVPLVGVGGIFTAADAWEKICAGASLVQIYTGFIYEGPRIVQRINQGLVEILKREGFSSLQEAIGCGAFTQQEISRNK